MRPKAQRGCTARLSWFTLKPFIFLVILGIWWLVVGCTPSTPEPSELATHRQAIAPAATVFALADTTLSRSDRDAAEGGSGEMVLDSGRRVLVRFDVAGLLSAVPAPGRVELRLELLEPLDAEARGGVWVDVFRADQSWMEESATWSCAAPESNGRRVICPVEARWTGGLERRSEPIASVWVPHGSTMLRMDLTEESTSYAEEAGLYGWILEVQEPPRVEHALRLSAREGASPPTLAAFSQESAPPPGAGLRWAPVADTVVAQGRPRHNFGTDDALEVRAQDRRHSLLRFDLPQIAAELEGRVVETAWLELTPIEPARRADADGIALLVYALNRPWSETTATWLCADALELDQRQGHCAPEDLWFPEQDADTPPWEAEPVGELQVPRGSTEPVRIEITAHLRAALATPETHQGWLVAIEDRDRRGRLTWGSHEHATPPALVIVLAPEPDLDAGEDTDLDVDGGSEDDSDSSPDIPDEDGSAPSPEDCTNGVDDDGDGLVDCEDPGCFEVCPVEDCANGLDDDGDQLIDCLDQECCLNTACTQEPPLPSCLPPVVGPSLSLQALGVQTVDLSSELVVVPEYAFLYALQHSDFVASPQSWSLGVHTAAQANDLSTLGLTAELQTGMQAFSGDLFLVTRDSWSPQSQRVEAIDYYVAAVSLQGTSPWLGTLPGLVTVSPGGLPSQDCCSDEALFEVCTPDLGVVPVPQCGDPRAEACPWRGVSGECMAPDELPEGFLAPDAQVRTIEFREMRSQSEIIEDNDCPVFESAPLGAGGRLNWVLLADAVICMMCQQSEFSCDPLVDDPPDYSLPEGGDPCAPAGRSAPEHCTQGQWSPDAIPSECLGICPDCFIPTCDNACSGTQTLCLQPMTGHPQAPPSAEGCVELPEICTQLETTEDSPICNPREDFNQNLLVFLRGCAGPSSTSQNGVTCCGENCACTESQRSANIKMCIRCDEQGQCFEFTEGNPLFDPHIAQDPGYTIGLSNTADAKEESRSHTPKTSTKPGGASSFWDNFVFDENEDTDPDDADPPNELIEYVFKLGGSSTPAVHDEAPKVPNNTHLGRQLEDIPAETVTAAPTNSTAGKSQAPRQSDMGDPILMGSGTLEIEVTDLAYPGAVRPLVFGRRYSSGGEVRSVLGSNWTYTWDQYIRVLTPGNAPSWAPSYCRNWAPMATCVLYHDGQGNQQLFIYNSALSLYLPTAGHFDSVRVLPGRQGWLLRRPDGHLLQFNTLGYLIEDRDRFGNGFKIFYEKNPLLRVYERYCSVDSSTLFRDQTDFDERLCAELASLFEDAPHPGVATAGLAPDATPPTLPWDARPEWLVEVGDQCTSNNIFSANDCEDAEQLRQARRYALYVLQQGPAARVPTGFHKLRPVRVRDDMGRQLTLSYWWPAQVQSSADFDAMPQAGLLKRVDGVGLSHIEFAYARPANYPARLGEMFLTQVVRSDDLRSFGFGAQTNQLFDPIGGSGGDAVLTPSRTITYTYQWPGSAASWSYDQDRALVHEKFLNYYKTMAGCDFTRDTVCIEPAVISQGGNPCWLAQLAEEGYVSQVADNIITVTFDDQIESETRYAGLNYLRAGFDQVYAQRYGGEELTTPDGQLSEENWQTNLPLERFVYQEEGLPEDETERFLLVSSQVLARYALEVPPSVPASAPPEACTADPVAGGCVSQNVSGTRSIDDFSCQSTLAYGPDGESGTPTVRPACEPLLVEARRQDLPAYRSLGSYFDLQETDSGEVKRLVRSRLSCAQLAAAEVSDPLHNDVLHALAPNAATPDDPTDLRALPVQGGCVPDVLPNGEPGLPPTHHLSCAYRANDPVQAARTPSGGRARIEANLRRICAWRQVQDRDGHTQLFGMNYRGQVLVEAVEEQLTLDAPPTWLVTERLYNADGLPREVRRPTPVAQSWMPEDGSTAFFYEEPSRLGNAGWNEARPAWWARRANLRAVVEHPATRSGVPAAPIVSQLTTYDPLFNQPIATLSGNAEERRLTASVMDYQELNLAGGELDALMRELMPWGFQFTHTFNPETQSLVFDYERIQSWQLPVEFSGEDLNADGVRGFPKGAAYAANNAKGVPIVVVQGGRSLDPEQETLRTGMLWWAPHGLPSAIIRPGASVTELRYWPASGPDKQGAATERLEEASNGGFRGFLAAVRTLHVDAETTERPGPAEAPCARLTGPWQWLLPATCQNVTEELGALGLPSELITLIKTYSQDGVTPPTTPAAPSSLTRILRYSLLGYPTEVEDVEPEHHTTFLYDTDGRLRQIRDPQGNTTRQIFNIRGHLIGVDVVTSTDEVSSEQRFGVDLEGRVLRACTARQEGGCDGVDETTPWEAASDETRVLTARRFTPAGRLEQERDPEGTITEYTWSSGNLPLALRIFGNSIGHQDEDRRVVWRWTVEGQPEGIDFGTEATRSEPSGALGLEFEYDGLRRLRSWTDVRGTRFVVERNAFGEVTRQQAWDPDQTLLSERTTVYDDLGRPIRLVDGGEIETQVEWTTLDTPWQVTRTGLGATVTSYDALGQAVWSRSPDGSMTVSAWDPHTRTTLQSVIRRGESEVLSTSTLTRTDALGLPVLAETISHSGQRTSSSWERRSDGRLVQAINAEGFTSQEDTDLLGQVTRSRIQREETDSTLFEETEYTYDGRGSLVEVLEPSGQLLHWSYNPWGDLTSFQGPGVGVASWAHDGLGRVVEQVRPSGEHLRTLFDPRGDPVEQRWVNSPLGETLLTERAFDGLGRVAEATEHPAALRALGITAPSVHRTAHYDLVGRMTRESFQVGELPVYEVSSSFEATPTGWLQTMTAPGNRTTLRRADLSGRLSQVEVDSQGLHTYQWMGGLPTSHSWADLPEAPTWNWSWSYDGFGMPTSWETSTPQAPTLFHHEVVRDRMHRQVSALEQLNLPGTSSSTWSSWRGYTFDARGHLSELLEWESAYVSPDLSGLIPHTVDDDAVRATGNSLPGSQRWVYGREEALGSPTSIQHANLPLSRWAATRSTGHRLAEVTLGSGTPQSVAHDTGGRLIQTGRWTLHFDPNDRLVSTDDQGDFAEGYVFTDDGRLAATLDEVGVREVFVYDGAQMLQSRDSSGGLRWQATWGAGLDELLAVESGQEPDNLRLALTDSRQNVRALVDATTSTPSAWAEYDPDGRVTVRSPNAEAINCSELGSDTVCPLPEGLPFGFNSAWRSNITGLVWMRARWYSPQLAQFLSLDPLGYPDGFNPYAFAGFDPVNGWDPWGLSTLQLNAWHGSDTSRAALRKRLGAWQESKEPVDTIWRDIDENGVRSDAGAPLGPRPYYGNPVARDWARGGYIDLAELLEAGHSCGACHAIVRWSWNPSSSIAGGWLPPDSTLDLDWYNSVSAVSKFLRDTMLEAVVSLAFETLAIEWAANAAQKRGWTYFLDDANKILERTKSTYGNVDASASYAGDDFVSLWKAVSEEKRDTIISHGFREVEFPRVEELDEYGDVISFSDGKSYFFKDKVWADQYNRHYGGGIIEIRVPKSDYDKFFKRYEIEYQGEGVFEVPIPFEDFPILNRFKKFWYP